MISVVKDAVEGWEEMDDRRVSRMVGKEDGDSEEMKSS
jgi:hypothetical protein